MRRRSAPADDENPHDAAVLKLAVKLAENRGHVAMNTFSNYLNHVADTEIDFPKIDLKTVA